MTRFAEGGLRVGMSATLAALLLVVCCPSGHTNPIPEDRAAKGRFRSEQVTLSIEPPILRVEGRYVFDCRQIETRTDLLFPFIPDPTMELPQLHSASFECVGSPPESLHVNQTMKQWWLWTLPEGFETDCTVVLQYTQKLSARRAGYLLTSTNRWLYPPDSIRITIQIPVGMHNPTFSYPVNEMGRDSLHVRYSLRLEKKFPPTDMVVTWDDN